MKLWEKGISTEASIENFTVGNDRHYDRYLAIYDVKASAAHARMLQKCGFLELLELNELLEGLTEIEQQGDGDAGSLMFLLGPQPCVGLEFLATAYIHLDG